MKSETELPQMFIDPDHPGIIRYVNDPMAGILAGRLAPQIVKAINSHATLTARVKQLEKALKASLAVLTEPGMQDVDEWKADQKKAVFQARAALAEGKEKP